MIRYTCASALLPVVEGALAANGYTIETPLQRLVGGDTLLVMMQGDAVVLLAESPHSDLAQVEVYGAAQSAVMVLLETLPIALHREPQAHRRPMAEAGKMELRPRAF
jgi:hypothetical protein